MRLMDFQEKQFIQEILGPLAKTAALENFDDAVVIDLADLAGIRNAPFLVYSMDQPSFVRHADASLDPFRFYGRWVAGTTCNDVIAMGGRCRGFSLALAAPLESKIDDVRSLVVGIKDVLDRCGATYEGGNLDSGDLGTVGFVWGIVSRDGIVRRSGAQPGDRIVVTGELGLGWLEYQLRKNKLTAQIAVEDKPTFLRYKLMPVGAAAAIADIAERGWFTSGMDLSDGLVEFLYSIVLHSDLGCEVDAQKLPVPLAARRNLPLFGSIEPRAAKVLRRTPELIALEPGYDSPLRHAFTIRPEVLPLAQEVFQEHDGSLYDIGQVTSESAVILRDAKTRSEIPPFWDDQLRQESKLGAWVKFLEEF
ncbi:MAG: thiamine-phosphate kinase [Gammaproteobacteria bacterium]